MYHNHCAHVETVHRIVDRGQVSATSLAHLQLTTSERAVLAGFIADRSLVLVPSGRVIAYALNISESYVSRSARLPVEERWAVLRGARPLVTRPLKPRLFTLSPTPVEEFDRTVDQLGFDLALDRLALLEQVGAIPNGAAR